MSCPSPSFCTAVGIYNVSRALIERWNGKRWSVQPTPNMVGATTSPPLVGVSCSSASACVAVGSYSGSGPKLVERWNGTRWSVQPTRTPRAAAYTKLTGVSCFSPSTCTAVGSYVHTAGPTVGLVERWNGTS